MGIIAKQSIKGSLYTYAGVVIAFVSTGLLLPKFFSESEVGLISLLIALSLFFSQFANLGFTSVNSRIFPYFRNEEKKHNGILTIGMITTFTGFIISLAAFFILKPYLISSNFEKSPLIADNIFLLVPLIFFASFFNFLDSYTRALFDAVVGSILKDFVVKILNLLLIIAFILDWINFKNFVFLYVIAYISPTILITIILILRKKFFVVKPNLQLLREHRKEIIKVAAFGIISGFSGTAVMSIDKSMTTYFLGLDIQGVYSIAFYFGSLVRIPSRAISKISSIVIAEAWKRTDLKEIKEVYQKSTINQQIIALLLFIGIFINIDNIFEMIPKFAAGKYVVLLIGGAFVVEMFGGVSPAIIVNSKYYRVYAYIMFITIVNLIISNIIFIRLYNMNGAALATFITLFISFILRFLFLYKKFQLQPYSYKHLIILLISGVTIGINFIIPKFSEFYIDMFVRSSIITIVFCGLIYFSKVSKEVQDIVVTVLKKVGVNIDDNRTI